MDGITDDALVTLRENVRPVIHSNIGSHYGWPGWLDRISASGLKKSMCAKVGRRITQRVKASSGGAKMKCTMAETGQARRRKNLSASKYHWVQ